MLPKPGDFFAVMYHYVRPPEDSRLNFLDRDNFMLQVKWLQESYGVVSRSEWQSYLEGGPTPSGALLTFDDGLKDHSTYVLPILQRLNMHGAFFSCSEPLHRRPLTVHLVHYLLAQYEPEKIWAALRARGLTGKMTEFVAPEGSNAYAPQEISAYEKAIKQTFNWSASSEPRELWLPDIFEETASLSPETFCDQWYMDEYDLKALQTAGHTVGSHSCSHRVMRFLSPGEVAVELRESKMQLEACTSETIREFCFPYGGTRSYSDAVLEALVKAGYTAALSVDPRPIAVRGREEARRFELPRYDCNLFPYGLASSPNRVGHHTFGSE